MNAKRLFIVSAALAAILALGISTVAAQNPNSPGNNGGHPAGYQGGRNGNAPRGNANSSMNSGFRVGLPPASADTLPADVIDLMIDGWMDEQHAYAVYGAVIDQFGSVRPFTNIQNSEAQHAAAWETLFTRYGIAVPEIPTFDLPVFASVSEACAIGASAEVANFDLYNSMLTAFEPYPDLLYVAQSLRDVSEFNHLPAFQNCAG